MKKENIRKIIESNVLILKSTKEVDAETYEEAINEMIEKLYNLIEIDQSLERFWNVD